MFLTASDEERELSHQARKFLGILNISVMGIGVMLFF